jgi:DNA invertase Pin-like site-specific DNA recombinase
MTTTAYSYIRFSSEQQAKGDSIRRQQDLATQFLERNKHLGLVLDTSLDLRDEGRSAYKGVHATKGALGVFLRMVEDRLIEKGSYLLVENFDRLSRQEPTKALRQFQDLIDAEIVVVTLHDGKIFDKDQMNSDGGISLILSVMMMARANEESKTKGLRVKAAWSNKFDQIAKGVMHTKRVPFWIDPSDKSKTLKDKVPVIKQIFKMAAEGYGSTVIAKTLNADNIPTATGRAKYWSAGTIKKLLKSPNVIGTLVTGDGVEHPSYFPKVITDSVYQKVANLNLSSKTARASSNNIHPLSGLVRCSKCGGAAHHVRSHGHKRKDGTRPVTRILVCAHSLVSNYDCPYLTRRYEDVLATVMEAVQEHKYADAKDQTLKEIRALENRERELSVFFDFPVDLKSVAARLQNKKVVQEMDEVKAKLKELKASRAPLNRRVFETAQEELEAGGGLKNATIRQLIKQIDIDFASGTLKIHFTDSGVKKTSIFEYQTIHMEPPEAEEYIASKRKSK